MNIRFIASAFFLMNVCSTYTMVRHAHTACKQNAITRLNNIKKHFHNTKSIDLVKQAALTGSTLTAQGIISAGCGTALGGVGMIAGGLLGLVTGATVAFIDERLVRGTTYKNRLGKNTGVDLIVAGLGSGAAIGSMSGYVVGSLAVGPKGLVLAPLMTALILYRADYESKKRELLTP